MLALAFLAGAAGAFSTEALKIHELYHSLDSSRFSLLVQNRVYFAVTASMIVASGIVASAMSIRIGDDMFMAFIHGAFAGPTLRAFSKAIATNARTELGARTGPSLREVL